MDIIRRVLSNVVNTIVPDSFREPSNTAPRKRSAGSYEPELTDDEEAPESFFSKRMRPSVDPGPSSCLNTTIIFEKPFGADVSRGKLVPIQLTCDNVRAVGKTKDDVIAVTRSSLASNSRQSVFNSSMSPFQRSHSQLLRKNDPLRKIQDSNSITKRFRKKTVPVFEAFKRNLLNYCPTSRLCTRADVIRLHERNDYMQMVQKVMASSALAIKSSKPSTSVDSGRSSQNGLKALPFVKSKLSEPELINPKTQWYNASNTTFYGPLASTPLCGIKASSGSDDIPSFPDEDRSSSKVIDTIDLSRESDSGDSVICETPVSTPKPAYTPKSLMKKSASAKKIESLRARIKLVLETSLGDIEKSNVEMNGDDENESSVNSSEKENDEETEVFTPVMKHRPINTLASEFQNSPFVDDNWLKAQKSSFAESRRERDEKIKHHETTLQILKDESRLDRDLAEIIRRNLKLTNIIVLEEVKEELKLPEITDEMRNVIIRARSSGRGLGEVITTTANNIEITKSDIKSLAPMQWLNDNVINSYLDLVALRSKSQNQWPSVYVFTTFFYPKYLNEGYSNILKRWTRKVDLFSYDLLIFPIHLGIHWCLAAADRRKKMIKYYDSLGGKNYQCPKALLQYLGKEHQERKKTSLDDSWITEIVEDIPQQQNGSDCGMFACKFAEYLSRDAELNFKQEDMNYYRERMIYEIITGELLYP
ncbi:unnamed protein product [Allacma fusca]|uniref:Ubiquitin-like protease family profile domain-containing protein n=1 Tax=Allacma fusca TaxID=39272 RepID=A0A8J2LSZ3_9HEXA|nr:unnamed protein product [Allacma fusca]